MSLAVKRQEKIHLDRIVEHFALTAGYKKLTDKLEDTSANDITVTGLAGSSQAILLSNLCRTIGRPIIAVTAGDDEANDLYDDLVFLVGDKIVGHFPARLSPPYEFRSPTAEIIGRRLSTLARLKNGDVNIIVAPIGALIEPTITLENFENSSLHLRTGEEIEINTLTMKLAKMGFRRVPLVEEVGDFALRGGLIDFFSPGFDYPIRVEFFDDEIDTIRQFEVATQRTTERLNNVNLLPRREVSVTPDTV